MADKIHFYMKTSIIAFVINIFFFCMTQLPAQDNCNLQLTEANDKYYLAEFDEAIRMAQDCIRSGKLDDKGQAFAYTIMGLAYHSKDQPAATRFSLTSALRLDATINLDTEAYPPSIRNLYREIKASLNDDKSSPVDTLPIPSPVPKPDTGKVFVFSAFSGKILVNSKPTVDIESNSSMTLNVPVTTKTIGVKAGNLIYYNNVKIRADRENLPVTLSSETSKVMTTLEEDTTQRTNERETSYERDVEQIKARFGLAHFAKIPAGSFRMGSEEGGSLDEKPAHWLRISQDFYMGKTEVTQAQWFAVMGTTVEDQKAKQNLVSTMGGKGANYPMYFVSWEDVQEFIRVLNEVHGQNLFRLPTEAEWEYACRAGDDRPSILNLDAKAWYAGNAGDNMHPVAQKQPNAWGLYDMLGNLWEWCSDWYDADYYRYSPGEDPPGPPTTQNSARRVLRGGYWANSKDYCRFAIRSKIVPQKRDKIIGFRLVRIIP